MADMMGGIDSSIPLNAGKGVAPPVNMLQQFGQYQGIANAMEQNKLIQAATAQTQQGTAIKARDALNTMFSGFLTLPQEQQTADTARQWASDLLNTHQITPETHQTLLQGINRAPDPASLVSGAKRGLLAMQSAPDQAAALGGAPTSVNDGQQIIPGVGRTAMGGILNPGQPGFTPTNGNVQTYPSRGELAGRVTGPVGPDGAPTQAPLGAITPPSLSGPAGQSMFPGNGRLPSALRNPSRAGGAPPSSAAGPTPVEPPGAAPGQMAVPFTTTAPPAAALPGQVTTGQGPAQQAAQGTTGATSAKAFADIAEQGVQAKSQAAIFQNMLADTSQFTTGPGQDRIKAFQAGLQRFASPLASAFGIKPETIAANESFDKLAAQIANAQGAGSDARLNVNMAGNPNSHTTPAGVDMILRQLTGNTDYQAARAKLANAWPNQADRSGFETSVAENLDPRSFQYTRLNGEQKTTYLKSLKDPKKFMKSYGWAEQQGLVGGANGQ